MPFSQRLAVPGIQPVGSARRQSAMVHTTTTRAAKPTRSSRTPHVMPPALEPSGTLLATDGDQPRARRPESADAAVGATDGVAASAGGIARRRARGAG